MAKVREQVGNASIEVEGDAEAVSESLEMFHLAVLSDSLRKIEMQLLPLQKQRRDIVKQIAEIKAHRLTMKATEPNTIQ